MTTRLVGTRRRTLKYIKNNFSILVCIMLALLLLYRPIAYFLRSLLFVSWGTNGGTYLPDYTALYPRCQRLFDILFAENAKQHYFSHYAVTFWPEITQSVQRLPTVWTFRRLNPGWGDIFRTRPDRPWGPPSLLYTGYRLISEGKAARSWR